MPQEQLVCARGRLGRYKQVLNIVEKGLIQANTSLKHDIDLMSKSRPLSRYIPKR